METPGPPRRIRNPEAFQAAIDRLIGDMERLGSCSHFFIPSAVAEAEYHTSDGETMGGVILVERCLWCEFERGLLVIPDEDYGEEES